METLERKIKNTNWKMKEGDSCWVEKDAELKRDVIYFTPVHIPPSPSPTSTIPPGAPPSQRCCIYYDKSFSNLFGYRELLISRICLFSLGWNDQDAKWIKKLYTLLACAALEVRCILHNICGFFPCLFLTRGRKHEQCHVVDSFDVLRQISESKTVFSISNQ